MANTSGDTKKHIIGEITGRNITDIKGCDSEYKDINLTKGIKEDKDDLKMYFSSILTNKTVDVSSLPFTEDIKQTILRLTNNAILGYSDKKYNYLGAYPGFRYYVITVLEQLYKNTAQRNPNKPEEPLMIGKDKKTFAAGISEAKMKELLNTNLIGVLLVYSRLLSCIDENLAADTTTKYTKELQAQTEILGKIRDAEITNLQANYTSIGLNTQLFTDDDLANMYNHAYWAQKGTAPQRLPRRYIPTNQTLYYYQGQPR